MSGGAGSATLYCLDAKTGETKWTNPTPVGDCGGVFDAGSQLIALTNKSELIAFKPSGEKFEEVAKVKVADTPTWALPILTGNKVIVKDTNSVTLWTVE
jgi:outer membrane protein assembly factor BamB